MILAVVNAVMSMVLMPACPLWSMMVITLDVLIIFALQVHGREAKQTNP